MKRLSLLGFILLTGCHEKGAALVPTAPTPSPLPPVASCTQPSYEWDLERFADSHSVRVRTKDARPDVMFVARGDWATVAQYGAVTKLPDFGRYLVVGLNACGSWSTWHEFDVVPNPDGSGGTVPPIPPVVPPTEYGEPCLPTPEGGRDDDSCPAGQQRRKP